MPEDQIVAVTVIGRDRPGIVATVGKALYELGCNLEDVTSTILRGQFTMTLIVKLASGTGVDRVQRSLSEACDPLELLVSARPIPEGSAELDQPDHIVSVYGADQPGILFRVADILAEAGCNITDLTSRVIGSEEPVYAVMLEVRIPEPEDVTQKLKSMSTELGLDVTVHPLEVELL